VIDESFHPVCRWHLEMRAAAAAAAAAAAMT